jgi:thiol:disulfide interchange protein
LNTHSPQPILGTAFHIPAFLPASFLWMRENKQGGFPILGDQVWLGDDDFKGVRSVRLGWENESF